MSELPRTIAEVEAGMAQGLHVGAQVYVSIRGEVACDAAVGLARTATGERPAAPMTTDTITLWLSSGKPVTAVAIAQLWERGLLELDDPVARHVPEFAAHGKDRITIRHLLTHTAPLRLADTGWPNATWEQMIARACAMRPEPRWVSGRAAGYSAHVTWYVLAEVVQRVGGEPLPAYLRERVFAPCGMTSTFVSMTPAEQSAHADRLAATQQTDSGAPADLGTETPAALAMPRPSGSVRGAARELGRFYEMMLARGRGMISSQTVDAMTARHRVNTRDKTFGAILDWGLGFMINSAHYGNADAPYQFGPHASTRAFGHSGNQSSVGFADPEHGLAVALVFNGLAGEAAHQPRVRRALGLIYEELGLAAGVSVGG
jgi:CubicO group peptidase (beta-lactamase class C family)